MQTNPKVSQTYKKDKGKVNHQINTQLAQLEHDRKFETKETKSLTQKTH